MKLLPTPVSMLLVLGVMVALRIVATGTADTPSPFAGGITEVIGFLTTIGTFVIFTAGLVWWVFWGRNNQQLKDQVAGWKDIAERLRIENADLKAEAVEAKAERADAEREAEELRKANLRLQGVVKG